MKPCPMVTSMVLTVLASLVDAHSWIEQLNLVDPTGNMVGQPGFTRGHIFRNDSTFNDASAEYQITGPVIPRDSVMCRDTQQQQEQQPNAGPVLQAPPKGVIALRYLENGHVTQKEIRPRKPPNGGTVYVYGTSQPEPNELFLNIHRVWNAKGTGGDGRGKLLSTQNFDDGQCYQVNPASQVYRQRVTQFPLNPAGENWCQQDIALPDEATSGLYTLYWVWDWPDLPDGSNSVNQEIYTSCMDIQIADNSGDVDVSRFTDASQFVPPKAWNSQAISSEMAEISNPTAVDDSRFTAAFSTNSGGNSAVPISTGPKGSTDTASLTTTPDSGSRSTIFPIPGLSSPTGDSFPTPTSVESGPVTPIATSFGSQSTQSFGPRISCTNAGHGHGHGGHHSNGLGGAGDTIAASDPNFGSPPTTTGSSSNPEAGSNGQISTVTEMTSVLETVMMTITAGTTLEKRLLKSSSAARPTPWAISADAMATGKGPAETRLLPALSTPSAAGTRTCTHLTTRHSHTGLRLRGRNPLFMVPNPREEGDRCQETSAGA